MTLLIFPPLFGSKVKMPFLLRTLEFLFVAPCVESNQGDCSNQKLPYLQCLSTVNSQELIRVDKDDQNKGGHQC